MSKLTKLTEALLPSAPSEWPMWARRTFLLTAPVSVPLWLLWWAVWMFGIVAGCLAVALIIVALWALSPVVGVLIWLWQTVSDLWCFPDEPALTETPPPPVTGRPSDPSKENA